MRMSETLVEVDHLSKRYCRSLNRSLWYGMKDLLREWTGQAKDQTQSVLRPGEFHALRDVSFELRRGECLGLVGTNGAGKSTLLKMINGLVKPDGGRVRIRGRMGALIELTAGFHPILTGRENIFVNGAILGMGRREIARRLDAIIDFAEIGDAIDAPVQTYSSGMRVRLGFAVAAFLEPDVLLVDEVLAVGDVRFRMKCYDHLRRLRENGTALIVVSHSTVDIQRATTRVIVLEHGRTTFDGPMAEGLLCYDRILLAAISHDDDQKHVQAMTCTCSNSSAPGERLRSGDDVLVELSVTVEQRPIDVRFVMHVDSSHHGRVCSFPFTAADRTLFQLSPGTWTGQFVIRNIPLGMGLYRISACVYGRDTTDHFRTFNSIGELEIAGPPPDPWGFGPYGLVNLSAASAGAAIDRTPVVQRTAAP